jgi:hypothetical protein
VLFDASRSSVSPVNRPTASASVLRNLPARLKGILITPEHIRFCLNRVLARFGLNHPASGSKRFIFERVPLQVYRIKIYAIAQLAVVSARRFENDVG